MTKRERRIVLWIAIFAFAMRLALVFRPEARLYSRPYIDDTFYALGCAYNLAHGNGLTSDGIHPTNGIQPLIVFLDSPLFFLAGDDKLLGLRFTIAFEALIDSVALIFFAGLIARFRKKREEAPPRFSAPIIGALLWAGLYNIFRQQMNGLETGLFGLGILVALHIYVGLRQGEPSLGQWGRFGALLGMLVLARIDGVFLILGLILIELLRLRTRALLPLLVMGVMSIVISSPWWIFNYVNFGSIMPQSGQSESIGVLLAANMFSGSVALADILSGFFYFPYGDFPPWAHWVWFICVPLSIAFVLIRTSILRRIHDRYNLSPLTPLAVAAIGFIIFYIGFFAAWWFLYRYFHPIRILWTLLLAIGLESIVASVVGRPQKIRRIAAGFASVFLLVALLFNANRYLTMFTTDDIYPGYLIGKWALKHPSYRIGMEQSGTASFVAPNIVNLDGKVNPDALKARKHGGIGQYIASSRFDYVIDWSLIAETLVAEAKTAGANYVADSSFRTMVRYRRVDQ